MTAFLFFFNLRFLEVQKNGIRFVVQYQLFLIFFNFQSSFIFDYVLLISIQRKCYINIAQNY